MRVRLVLVPVLVLALLTSCATRADRAIRGGQAGNGVAALSVVDILARASAALVAAKSYHLKGTGPLQLSQADLVVRGTDYVGTISFYGTNMQVTKLSHDYYIKEPREVLAPLVGVPPGAMSAARGKYLKLNTDNSIFIISNGLFFVDDILRPNRTYKKGAARLIDGAPAITLTDEDGATLYVATTGKPYPLRFDDYAEHLIGRVRFSEFDAPAVIQAPAAADVVDLATL